MLRAVWTAPFNGARSRSTMSQMRGPLILSYSCRKRFPTPRICGHGIPGHKFLRLWSEFARRFADSLQTALDSVVRLGVPNEGIDVHTRGESFYPDNVLQNVSEPRVWTSMPSLGTPRR